MVLMKLPNTDILLVRCPPGVPADRRTDTPGKYERLLGDELVKTYAPLLPRLWMMDFAYNEAVHLIEMVTLGLLLRFYRWVGMAGNVKWWTRRCHT